MKNRVSITQDNPWFVRVQFNAYKCVSQVVWTL